MNPKNVWGIILIVLGVLFILNGIIDFQEISVVENEISLLNKTYIRFFGKSNLNLLEDGLNHSHALLQNAKVKCTLSILLGIAGAFFGTLMLKGRGSSRPSKIEQHVTSYNNDPLQSMINDKFSMQNQKDKSENDNLRWMHPDMRKDCNKKSFKF